MSDIDITVSVVDLVLSFLIAVIMVFLVIDLIIFKGKFKAFQKSFKDTMERLNTLTKRSNDKFTAPEDREEK